MNLIRPNGLVERLWFGPRQQVDLENYGRVQLGPATAETPRLGAQRTGVRSAGAGPISCAAASST